MFCIQILFGGARVPKRGTRKELVIRPSGAFLTNKRSGILFPIRIQTSLQINLRAFISLNHGNKIFYKIFARVAKNLKWPRTTDKITTKKLRRSIVDIWCLQVNPICNFLMLHEWCETYIGPEIFDTYGLNWLIDQDT